MGKFIHFRPTLDGWELRKGINDMQGFDNFPEPKIVIACLEACKRLNEPSLATRYLEALKVLEFYIFYIILYRQKNVIFKFK